MRRIVVGDILRRLVARTIAKQVAKKVEAATAPFQCALSTKAPSCACFSVALQRGSHNTSNKGWEGEQGDPLMPMLFALGQHKSLVKAQARLSGNEHLFALLGDVYITNQPGRVIEAYRPTQASASTMEKPECATVVGWSLKASRS